MKYIFIDFEMCAIDREHKKERRICSMEIIEFGAVMLDDDYSEISSFKSYVKPEFCKELPERYTSLTGITQDMILAAERFEKVFQEFSDWCTAPEDDYIIYAWSENDLKQLTGEIRMKEIELSEEQEDMLEEWYDFQREYCDMLHLQQVISLDKALDMAGLGFDGRMHDALWDARNTAQLFKNTRNEEEFAIVREKIKEVLEPKPPLTVSLGDILKAKMEAAASGSGKNRRR